MQLFLKAFMICFSISQATSIVTANAFGKKIANSIILSAQAGMIILSLAIFILCGLLWVFHREIFSIFTKDTFVINVLSGLIYFLLIEIICDSLPLGIMGPLNGRGDIKIPTIFQIVAFLIIRISACYILAFKFNLGICGLVIGLAVGGVASLILNGARIIYLTHRDSKKYVY